MDFQSLMTHRVNIHAMYFRIAERHARMYHERDGEYKALERGAIDVDELSEVSRRMEEAYERREQSAVVAITFAGMALEAFFYDYAAEMLGDTFVREHLDRLDLKSKYLVYPRLVCGKEPSKSTDAYARLGRLVKLRNDLVHFKSQPFPIEELGRASDFHTQLNERLRFGVGDSLDCVSAVMTELDNLDGGSSSHLRRMRGT
jgi:hypothetical protein